MQARIIVDCCEFEFNRRLAPFLEEGWDIHGDLKVSNDGRFIVMIIKEAVAPTRFQMLAGARRV